MTTIRLAEMRRSNACLRRQAASLLGNCSWADGELDFAAARFHFFEGVREIREPNLFGDEVVGEDISTANGFHRFANKPRGVMEGRDELDFGIMNRSRLDLHARVGGQAA